jgi:hypothetical protein
MTLACSNAVSYVSASTTLVHSIGPTSSISASSAHSRAVLDKSGNGGKVIERALNGALRCDDCHAWDIRAMLARTL